MHERRARALALTVAGAGICWAWAALAGPVKAAKPAEPAKPAAAPKPEVVKPPAGLIEAEPPPFSDGAFPCSTCHKDLEKNPARRDLAYHDEQQTILNHGPDRWCLDCHDLQDRDVLHLTNGTPVPFSESYRLCGQCHGDKLRDWKAGIHGKRVGRWDGEKTYFLCVNCHNPHAPRFQGVTEVVSAGKPTVAPTLTPIRPEPRPVRPEEQRR